MKNKVFIRVGIIAVLTFFSIIYFAQDKSENLLPMVDGGVVGESLISEDEILSGGVRKDGIPSIDDPKFISIDAANMLTDEDMGVSITFGDEKRFYPYRILVFHEIVNDVIGKRAVAVTYCPLCGTGIVFNPVVNGERLEFGVSGKLWQSNLLMYDRSTDSLWSQVLGQAVVGPLAGTELELVPSDIVSFGAFKQTYPNGRVLSEDTGARRNYGQDPYGSYYTSSHLMFPVRAQDDRLHEKDLVLGVIIEGQPKAYSLEAIKREVNFTDVIEDVTLEFIWDAKKEEVAIFRREMVGETRVVPFPGFWFSWVAAHPDTLLYK